MRGHPGVMVEKKKKKTFVVNREGLWRDLHNYIRNYPTLQKCTHENVVTIGLLQRLPILEGIFTILQWIL